MQDNFLCYVSCLDRDSPWEECRLENVDVNVQICDMQASEKCELQKARLKECETREAFTAFGDGGSSMIDEECHDST